MSAPVPPMTPPWVSVVPEAVLKMPPPAFSVVARDVVKLPVVCSVPPPKSSVPAALPRLASAATEIVPPLIEVPPV